jgi:hypothetical protein
VWLLCKGGRGIQIGVKTDGNGRKNIYPVFTFTFFSRTETKTGITETEMNGTYSVSRKRTNSDGNDENKSLYLVFMGVVFFSASRTASWTAFRAVRTASWTAFRAVRTAASWLFC